MAGKERSSSHGRGSIEGGSARGKDSVPGRDPHPSPCAAMVFPSLESFHPRRSSRLVDNTKLTLREASHFITTAITAEEDGSKEEEEKGPEEGIGYYNTLNLCFSKVGFKLISFNQFLHFLRKILMIYTNP